MTFLEVPREFNLKNSLMLELKSSNDVSNETIVNYFRKVLDNALIKDEVF